MAQSWHSLGVKFPMFFFSTCGSTHRGNILVYKKWNEVDYKTEFDVDIL